MPKAPIKIGRGLFIILGVLIVVPTIFFLFRWYRNRKIFATTSAVQVELPKGVGKKDLKNLTNEQKNKLNNQIASAISLKFQKARISPEMSRPLVVVLTENNRPILPDLKIDVTPSPVSLVSTPTSVATTPTEIIPTATPTPGCMDTDGGKDYFIKGTLTTSYGDKKTDFCSDPNIVGEYSCVPEASFAFDGYICPGKCTDGACEKAEEKVTPTVVPSVSQCTDSDGGKNYYVQGTIDYKRYEGGQLKAVSKPSDDCVYGMLDGVWKENLLREYFCTPQLQVDYEYYDCPNGCQDGVCKGQGATPTPSAVPTPAVGGGENELRFTITKEASDAYWNKNRQDLANDVERIYQAAKKIYGLPFRSLDVSIVLSGGFGLYYNVSQNSIVFDPNQIPTRQDLVWMILQAFHDDLIYYMPQNWEEGMREIATIEVYRTVFDPSYSEPHLNLPLWQIIDGDGLANKDGNLYVSDRFTDVDYYALAVTTLYKPYLEDNQFIAKFNQAVYKEKIDSQLKSKLNDLAAGLISSVEGNSSREFFLNNFILRTTGSSGWILYPKVYNNQVVLSVRATQGSPNGVRSGKSGLAITFKAQDGERNYLFTKDITTDSNGIAQLGVLPKLDEVDPNFATFSGAVHFSINIPGYAGPHFWYPYFYGKPVVPGGEGGVGLFGAIGERKAGFVKASYGPSVEVNLTKGAFIIGAGDYRGTVDLQYSKENRQVEKNFKVTKNQGPYYAETKMSPLPVPTSSAGSQTRGSPLAPSTCASDWQEYKDEKFGFKLKIPSGWTDDSIDEFQSNSLIYRHLISTTTPQKQMDPRYKISSFDVLASTSDFKNNSDYSSWFENNTGNQKKEQVDFKGISAEKYTDETEMPCSGQEEQNVTSCGHRSEMYYFKENDVYYLLSLSIYTTPELKDQNEKTLQCFLDNFETSGEEEVINGMKIFTSKTLNFKIKYPAALFVHEWPSDYQPRMDLGKPDSDRNVVQFFENKDLNGAKITIRRDTNPLRKSAWDFAKAYWSASDERLSHWKPTEITFTVLTVNVQGGGKEKTYFIPQENWMYIFDASEDSLQDDIEKMLPTFEFLNPPAGPSASEEIPKDLKKCSEDLLSTDEKIEEAADEWWTKEDPCGKLPKDEVCGYIRSVFDSGQEGSSSQTYRNLCSYCSFFNKDSFRELRGTKMYSLGYKEEGCP